MMKLRYDDRLSMCEFRNKCRLEYDEVSDRTVSFTYYFNSRLEEERAKELDRIEKAKADCTIEAFAYIDQHYKYMKRTILSEKNVSYKTLNRALTNYVCDIFSAADKSKVSMHIALKYRVLTKRMLISVDVFLSFVCSYTVFLVFNAIGDQYIHILTIIVFILLIGLFESISLKSLVSRIISK